MNYKKIKKCKNYIHEKKIEIKSFLMDSIKLLLNNNTCKSKSKAKAKQESTIHKSKPIENVYYSQVKA